jgi:hypothetical protein
MKLAFVLTFKPNFQEDRMSSKRIKFLKQETETMYRVGKGGN